MAYRNGTYVAFHAEGTSDPTESDMKYYNLLKAWHEHEDIEFEMINSHDKTAAVRDSSKKETLRSRLRERLNNSRNMVLIVGDTTRLDNDWVPFEIAYAVDTCEIPIIVAYPGFNWIMSAADIEALRSQTPGGVQSTPLQYKWPQAFAVRAANGSAKYIEVPFKIEPIKDAIKRFDHNSLPAERGDTYTLRSYRMWGLL